MPRVAPLNRPASSAVVLAAVVGSTSVVILGTPISITRGSRASMRVEVLQKKLSHSPHYLTT